MASFEGEVHDVTPASYFEGPFMVKRNGRYFLMNSTGNTIKDTLGSVKSIARQELRPEYAWKPIAFVAKSSTDGEHWTVVADYSDKPTSGSPIVIEKPVSAHYLRLSFPERVKGSALSLFEWAAY
jgi:hypothetical protein